MINIFKIIINELNLLNNNEKYYIKNIIFVEK